MSFGEAGDGGFAGVFDFHAREGAAEEMAFFEDGLREDELFAAGAAGGNVYGWPEAELGGFAVEDHFHVTRAFEFLEDEIVHAGTCFDQGAGDDGEAACFFGVAGGGEDLAGLFEGSDVETACHGAACASLGGVVGTGQAGEGVHEEDYVPACFHLAFGVFDSEFGNGDVVFWLFVIGAGKDVSRDDAAHIGDFFGALVHEEHNDVAIRMVGVDTEGDVPQEDGFACAGRGHDEAALAFADGAEDVEDAGGHGARVLKIEPSVGGDGGELGVVHAPLAVFDGEAVYGVHILHLGVGEAGVLLSLSGDEAARLQLEAADELAGHKGVCGAGFAVALGVEEGASFVVLRGKDAADGYVV